MTNPTQLTAYDTSGIAQPAQSSTTKPFYDNNATTTAVQHFPNPTQRFFMVKVTGCTECKYHLGAYCAHPSVDKIISTAFRGDLFDENAQQLTKTCPMYPQSQEVNP